MEVVNKIKVYEIDGDDKIKYDTSIEIKSHWNYKDFIVLNIFGKEITVVAKDLEKAIQNSINVSR